MAEVSVRFAGPVDRSLWRRFARRFRHVPAAAAAGAVVVASAAEPNLSGYWGDGEGYVVAIHQTGARVAAHSLNEAESFSAMLDGENRIEGMINLWWDDRMADVCGRDFAERLPFTGSVNRDYDRIRISYLSSFHSEDDCSFQRRERRTATLRGHDPRSLGDDL